MIQTYDEALEYLNSYLSRSLGTLHTQERGIQKLKSYLKLFDSPQEKLKIIHVAGTSGKGSTCYILSSLLQNQNLKTGLHLSPYLIDLRERFVINMNLIQKKKFIEYINQAKPVIEENKEKFGVLSYFELITLLTFYIFEKERVDVAILETGVGGLYDGTNVVDNKNKICILTKIGFDHQNILGKSLEEIAGQKAGIIQENNEIIILEQKEKVMKEFLNKAKEKNANVYKCKAQDIKLSLLGEFQKENCSLALQALKVFERKYNLKFSKEKIKETLKNLRFYGRLDLHLINGKSVILDGAHNPQKVDNLVNSLIKIYPNQKFNSIIAFKKARENISEMCNKLESISDSITITSFKAFQDSPIEAMSLKNIKKETNKEYNYNKDPVELLKEKLKENKPILITGSFYLLSEIYHYLIRENFLKVNSSNFFSSTISQSFSSNSGKNVSPTNFPLTKDRYNSSA